MGRTPTPATVVVAVFTALLASACYAQHPFPTAELRNLDGYSVYKEVEEVELAPYYSPSPYSPSWGPPYHTSRIVTDRPYRVVTLEGEQLLFTSETPLILYLKDGRVFESRYRTVEVKEGRFTGITLKGGERVSVPLSALDAVALKRPDTGATLLVTLGVVGGTLLLLSVALLAAGG